MRNGKGWESTHHIVIVLQNSQAPRESCTVSISIHENLYNLHGLNMLQLVSGDKESFIDWDIAEKRFYIKADHDAIIAGFFLFQDLHKVCCVFYEGAGISSQW